MSTAASVLGMEIVFLGGSTEDTFTFEKVEGQPPSGRASRRAAPARARLAVPPPARRRAVAHERRRNDPDYSDAAKRDELGITSYVGVPIRTAPAGRRRRCAASTAARSRCPTSARGAAVAGRRHRRPPRPAHHEGLVIRRAPEGGWSVGEPQTGDLTSAMVLADLLASELAPGNRPPKGDAPLDEVGQLRMSVKQLEHALAARVVVGAGDRVLPERQRSSPRQAFERCARWPRSRGRKVHDLSREIVMSATDPAVPLPPEIAGRR
jgi:hypothetical protein